jgi:hypothetical protein
MPGNLRLTLFQPQAEWPQERVNLSQQDIQLQELAPASWKMSEPTSIIYH